MSTPADIEQIIRDDGRYPPEAFEFLNIGLKRAAQRRHGEDKPNVSRHVSGEEICLALRDMAVKQWGMLAPTVLKSWNITQTFDFGEMVYLMIKHGVWQKTPEDTVEHFRDVYNFKTAFGGGGDFRLSQ
ncbi:MAG: Minf_1886 family protein [Planctomycetota bacterium]|jgi:uncharacterized repeat protein (TIGR04138 family)